MSDQGWIHFPQLLGRIKFMIVCRKRMNAISRSGAVSLLTFVDPAHHSHTHDMYVQVGKKFGSQATTALHRTKLDNPIRPISAHGADILYIYFLIILVQSSDDAHTHFTSCACQ